MARFDQYIKLLLENIEPEKLEYPSIKTNYGAYRQGPYDWRNFQVGKYYSDGDVHRFILSLDPEFEDEHRVVGIYQLQEVDPQSLEDSPWGIHDHRIEDYTQRTTQAPPIVIDEEGTIIDGGHRLEAAKRRGDKLIRVFVPVSK